MTANIFIARARAQTNRRFVRASNRRFVGKGGDGDLQIEDLLGEGVRFVRERKLSFAPLVHDDQNRF